VVPTVVSSRPKLTPNRVVVTSQLQRGPGSALGRGHRDEQVVRAQQQLHDMSGPPPGHGYSDRGRRAALTHCNATSNGKLNYECPRRDRTVKGDASQRSRQYTKALCSAYYCRVGVIVRLASLQACSQRWHTSAQILQC
jgi:hypothetical protein